VMTTARRAILVVMVEVCVLTVLFGLAMNAIPGMSAREHEGDMLRHLGHVFVDQPLQNVAWLSWFGNKAIFSWAVSIVLGILLLSAVNTAMGALVSIQYMMARDDELPQPFTMLNRFGVPWIVLLIAMFGPILVIDVQGSANALHGLADMYGIGVVGAIAVNLGSTAFNYRLSMLRHERWVMMVTFVILAVIEITIAVTKPHAAIFAGAVLVVGFVARAMHKGFRFEIPVANGWLGRTFFPAVRAAQHAGLPAEEIQSVRTRQLGPDRPVTAVMVAARGVTPTLRFAVDLARAHKAMLYVLFVRESFTTIPVPQPEKSDAEAQELFTAVKAIAADVKVETIYAVSDDPAWMILDHAAMTGVDTLIIGHSQRGALTRVLRGNLVRRLAKQLPEEIKLVIVG